MKHRVFWILILSILAYEVYNIATRQELHTGPGFKKLFEKTGNEKILNVILSNKKAYEVWENYKNKTLKKEQEKGFYNYINKLAEKTSLSYAKIITSDIKQDKNGLSALYINMEIKGEFLKVYNFINYIETTPLYLLVDSININKENNNLINAKIDLRIQIMDSTDEKYNSSSYSALSKIPIKNNISNLKDPFYKY